VNAGEGLEGYKGLHGTEGCGDGERASNASAKAHASQVVPVSGPRSKAIALKRARLACASPPIARWSAFHERVAQVRRASLLRAEERRMMPMLQEHVTHEN
jgi:hypothetical protein